MIRTYSISDSPSHKDYYRVSIKREGASAPGLPAGISSTHFHDQVEVGTRLWVKAPRGEFYLDPGADTPVVLLSGGLGLTPKISMLNAIVESGSQRPTWFVHGARDGRVHAMGAHVRHLARRTTIFASTSATANRARRTCQAATTKTAARSTSSFSSASCPGATSNSTCAGRSLGEIRSFRRGFNFRDLGGYPARDGRSIKWRRLFRSDALDHMTDGDVEYVDNTLGVVTVVDLRNPDQIQNCPIP